MDPNLYIKKIIPLTGIMNYQAFAIHVYQPKQLSR